MTEDLTRTDGEALAETVDVSLTGDTGREALVGQAAGAIDVSAPGAGEVVNISLVKGQTATLNFDATAATPLVDGNDFVLTFDTNGDGEADSRIVFQNLVEESQGADAPILVIGGVELSAALLIGQAQALLEGETLETAAGGTTLLGGGGSAYSDDVGTIIGLLDAQGALPGTELQFNLLSGGNDIDPALFSFLLGSVTEVVGTEIDGQIFNGGFEDWDHRQDDCETGASPMQLVFVPGEGVVTALTISQIPEGTDVFRGDPLNEDGSINWDNRVELTFVNGFATIDGLTPADFTEVGIYFLSPVNSDADLNLIVTGSGTATNGEAASVTAPVTFVIDAVVDMAQLSIVSGEEGDFGDFVTTWQDGSGNVFVDDGGEGGETFVDSAGYSGSDPSVESLAHGGYVVLWNDDQPDDDSRDSGGIQAQVYDAQGNPRGERIDVDGDADAGDSRYPDVAALADGGFVAVWRSGDSLSVRMYEYGKEAGDIVEIDMPPVGDGDKFDLGEPTITSLEDGGFVVSWVYGSTSDETPYNEDVYLQRFDAAGEVVGDRVQIETPESDSSPDVSALADGGYVLVWENYGGGSEDDDGFNDVKIQRYDADNILVLDTTVSAPDSSEESNAEVAGLNNGGFVVTFTSNEVDANGQVEVRVFDNTNTEVNSFTLDAPNSNYAYEAHVSSLANGGFVVTWVVSGGQQSFNDGGNGGILYTQRFDADGNAVDAEPVQLGDYYSNPDDPHVDGLDCDDNSAVKVFNEDNAEQVSADKSSDGGNNFVDQSQNYDLGFTAAIGSDRDGSEELTVIKIGLVDQLIGEDEPVGSELVDPSGTEFEDRTFELTSGGEAGPDQGEAFLVVGGNRVEDGEEIGVWAIWAELDGEGNLVLDTEGRPVLHSGLVTATATIADGELTLDFENDANSDKRIWEVHLDGSTPTTYEEVQLDDERQPITDHGDVVTVTIDTEVVGSIPIDGTKLEIELPQHADDDFDVNYSVTTRDNAQDAELLDATDGDQNNNETTATGTLQVSIEAIADGVVATDDGDKSFDEDDEALVDNHGVDRPEDNLVIDVTAKAELIDTDGSEAIKTVVVELDGADGEAYFVNAAGEKLEDGDTIEFSFTTPSGLSVPAKGVVQLSGDNDHILTITFSDDEHVLAGSLALTDQISVHHPIDDSDDYDVTVSFTSEEVNPEGDVKEGGEEKIQSTEYSVDITGVAGEAEDALGYVADDADDDSYEAVADDNDGDHQTVTYREDDETAVANHGVKETDSSGSQVEVFNDEQHLVVDVKYSVGTEDGQDQHGSDDPDFPNVDNDHSEAITVIEINKDDSHGKWFDQSGGGLIQDQQTIELFGTYVDLDTGLVVEGKIYAKVAFSGSGDGITDPVMTLTFTTPLVQSVDLSGYVGVWHPIDDSTNYELTFKTTTVEYDDDGVQAFIDGTSTDIDDLTPVGDPAVADDSGVTVQLTGVAGGASDELGYVNGDNEDTADYTVTDASGNVVVTYKEDNQNDADKHGATEDGVLQAENNLLVDVKFSASTEDGEDQHEIATPGDDANVDNDHSEAITEITIDKTTSDGKWFNADENADITNQTTTITLTGTYVNASGVVVTGDVIAEVGLSGTVMTLTFITPLVQSVDLSGFVGVKLPTDDSTDFDLNFTTTTVEYDDDGVQTFLDNGTGDITDLTPVGDPAVVTETVEIVVEGVVGRAETDLFNGDATVSRSEDDQVNVPGHGDGATPAETGLSIKVDYTASTEDGSGQHGATVGDDTFVDADKSEGVQKILLDKGESDGKWTVTGRTDPADSNTEITVDLSAANGQTTTLYVLVTDSDGNAVWTEATLSLVDSDIDADNSAGGLELEIAFETPIDVQSVDLNDVVTIEHDIDDSTDYTLTVKTTTVEYDDDGNTIVDSIDVTDEVEVVLTGVAGEAEDALGYVNTDTSGNNFDAVADDNNGDHETVTYTEDDETAVANHGVKETDISGNQVEVFNDEQKLHVDIKYSVGTEDGQDQHGSDDPDFPDVDNDHSEAITQIVIDKGASDGEWFGANIVGEQTNDEGLIQHGDFIQVSGTYVDDNGDVVPGLLTAEVKIDGSKMTLVFEHPLVQSVDLSGFVSVQHPLDDSTNYELTFETTTVEYDDDGVQAYLENGTPLVQVGDAAVADDSGVSVQLTGVAGGASDELGYVNDDNEDTADYTVTDASGNVVVTYKEDNQNDADKHGATEDGVLQAENNLVVDVKFSASTEDGEDQHGPAGDADPAVDDEDVDNDHSEAITVITVDKTASDGKWFNADENVDIADQTTITLTGSYVDTDPNSGTFGQVVTGPVTATVGLNGSVMTLTFTTPLVQSVDLSGFVGVKLPTDDSTDFDLNFTTTTVEYDDDGVQTFLDNATGDIADLTPVGDPAVVTETVEIVVEGVVGRAETDLFAGQDQNLAEDDQASVAGHGDGANPAETGLSIKVDYTASTEDGAGQHGATVGDDTFVDADKSEGVQKILLDYGDSDGAWTVTGKEVTAGDPAAVAAVATTLTEADLPATLMLEISTGVWEEATVTLSGDDLEIVFTNPIDVQSVSLNEIVTIEHDIDDSSDYTLTVKTTTIEYDDDGGASNTIDVTDEVEIVIAGVAGAAETGFDYGDATTLGDGNDNDSIEYSEDNEADVDDRPDGHGAGADESGLSVAVKYSASTEDGQGQHGNGTDAADADKSEGIAKIVLGKGESDGEWAVGDETIPQAIAADNPDGFTVSKEPVVIDGNEATIYINLDGDLVIEFVDPVLVQSVDLGAFVSVEHDIDDSTPYTLSATTTTYEYDDDQLDDSADGLVDGAVHVSEAVSETQEFDIVINAVVGDANIDRSGFADEDGYLSHEDGTNVYVFEEDDQGTVENVDAGPLTIATAFKISTEDGAGQDRNADGTPKTTGVDADKSEALTKVVLTISENGERDDSDVYTTGATFGNADGSAITAPGLTIYVNADGSIADGPGAGVTSFFANVTLENDGHTLTLDFADQGTPVASPQMLQNLDLGGLFTVVNPQHSDLDVKLSVEVTTTEYGDDGTQAPTTR